MTTRTITFNDNDDGRDFAATWAAALMGLIGMEVNIRSTIESGYPDYENVRIDGMNARMAPEPDTMRILAVDTGVIAEIELPEIQSVEVL